MGKGSRNRQVRTDDKIVNPQKYVEKKKAPKHLSTIITAICAVILVVALVATSLVSGGTLLRSKKALKSDNFTVNGAMMSYFAHGYYTNMINSYSEAYSSFLSSYGSDAIYTLMGIDPNVSLKEQIQSETTGMTWYDYVLTGSRAEVEEVLVYCEAAKAAGIELDDEDYAEIDYNIETMKMYASLYGYSWNSYLATNYGTGVREKDIRASLELSFLANKYIDVLNEKFLEEATEDRVNAYYDEHTTDYLSVDYLSYTLTAEMADLLDDATEEAKAEAKEAFLADKAEIQETIASFAAATTVEEFRTLIENYLTESLQDSFTEKYYDEYLAEAEGETDEEKDAYAKEKVQEKIAEEVEAQIDAMLTEEAAYADSTSLDKWMFGADATVGATFVYDSDDAAADEAAAKEDTEEESTEEETTETEEEEEETSFETTAYIIVRASSRVEDATYNVSYVVMDKTSFDETKANEVLAAFEAGDKTSEALLALTETYTDASSISQENIVNGFFGSDEADGWVFNEERVAGDYALLETSIDSTNYYILVLIDEVAEPEWYVNCRDDLASADFDAWFEQAEQTYPVYANEKALGDLPL